MYKVPPVRNFLVEAVDDKWVYWGLCHILQITHDYEESMSSGTCGVIHLNSPDDMRAAFRLVDRVADHDYFATEPA